MKSVFWILSAGALASAAVAVSLSRAEVDVELGGAAVAAVPADQTDAKAKF